jgi:hypothetical protein
MRDIDGLVDVGVGGELVRVTRSPYSLQILKRGVIWNVKDVTTAAAWEAAMRCIEGHRM